MAMFKEGRAGMRIHVTTHTSKKGSNMNKMDGIQSVSTSVKLNPICKFRAQCGNSVCAHCYASKLVGYRRKLAECLETNHEILNNHLLSETEAMQVEFTTALGRIEAFGDVASVTCARNYIRIIRANPETKFGIWTKNCGIWLAAFHKEGKPDNTTFVVSSPRLNEPVEIPELIRPYVDHVFTVWDKEHYTFGNTETECAGLCCRKCRKCYRKETSFYINEKLR